MEGLFMCVALLFGFIAVSIFFSVAKEHIVERRNKYHGTKVDKYEKDN